VGGLLFGARVGGPLEVPQVDDGSARRIVHGGESLESVASRRADRAVVGCFRVECDRARWTSGHGHVETEVAQVVQTQLDGLGGGRNVDRRRGTPTPKHQAAQRQGRRGSDHGS
jgi:hypothetical protein